MRKSIILLTICLSGAEPKGKQVAAPVVMDNISSPKACVIHLSPYRWNNYLAVRFCRNGKLLLPDGMFVTRFTDTLDWFKPPSRPDRVLDTWQREGDFRFGNVYMKFSSVTSYKFERYDDVYFRCISGRDTMHAVIVSNTLDNSLYDSIPFKPGYYKIYSSGYGVRESTRRGPENVGRFFAPYFRKHQRRLAKHNPFAGCTYYKYRGVPGPNDVADGPLRPADIIEFMLTQVDFHKFSVGRVEPMPKWIRQKNLVVPEK